MTEEPSNDEPFGLINYQEHSPKGLTSDREAVAKALAAAYRLLLTGNSNQFTVSEGTGEDDNLATKEIDES